MGCASSQEYDYSSIRMNSLRVISDLVPLPEKYIDDLPINITFSKWSKIMPVYTTINEMNNQTLWCKFVHVVKKANHSGPLIIFENNCVTIFTNHPPFLFGFDGIYKINADPEQFDTYVRGKNRGFTHVIIISYQMLKRIKPATNLYKFRLVIQI